MIRKTKDMKKPERLDNPLFIEEVQKHYRETSITKQALLRKFRITEIDLIAIMKVDLNKK